MDWQYLKGRLNKADPISRTAVPGSYNALSTSSSTPFRSCCRCAAACTELRRYCWSPLNLRLLCMYSS
jgi:hypothetical protein